MRKIDRFDKYMLFKGLNDNKVTIDLGLSVGTIGKSRKEGRDLSDRVIEQILNFYNDLNKVWLMTGEGEMLKEDSDKAMGDTGITTFESTYQKLVPLIPLFAQGGRLNDFTESVKPIDCEKVISPIKGAEFAITVTGDSMSPEYPNGTQVLIKRINEKAFIDWGRVYVLDTCNGIVIKKIMPTSDEKRIKCVSINPEYPPFEVSLQDIFGLYRVMLSMSLK